MNNQVKITINNKEYYCDMEVLKLVDRLCDKVELLEYNRDKAIEYIKINNLYYYDRLELNIYKERFKEDIDKLLSILRGEDNE